MFGIDDAISAGGSIVGGLLGGIFSGNSNEKARNALNDSFNAAMKAVGDPELAKAIVLQQYKSAGTLTPEMEQYINAGPSKMENLQEDAAGKEGKAAQLNALRTLQQVGAGGMTAMQRADLNKARMDADRDTQAKLASIMQNAQARGTAGGGSELAAQLSAAQEGANRQSEQGDRIAAMAQQNALEAMGKAGGLGGDIRGQSFNINAERAKAGDIRNQFDVQNMINAQTRNVGSKNTAQQFNLQNAQNIANANITGANQAAADAKNRQMNQAVNIANLQTQHGKDLSNVYTGQGKNAAETATKIGTAVGQIGAGIFNGPSVPGEKDDDSYVPTYNRFGQTPQR